MRRLALVVSLPALVLLACASDPAADGGNTTADDLVQTTPIEPVDWLACWVVQDTSTTTEFFMRHELRCAPRVPTDYPLAFGRFIVEAHTANGKHLSKVFEGTDEAFIGGLDNDAFPVRVQTRLQITSDSVSERGFGLLRETTIDSVGQRSAAAPEVYRAPFSLWPVEITFVGRASETAYVHVQEYSVSVAPYGVGYNFTLGAQLSDQLPVSPKVAATNPASLLLIEPPSKTITLSLIGRSEMVDVQLTGPGNYEFDGEALKKVGGQPDTPTPNDPAAPPPVVDETPGCGGANEAACGATNGSSGSCDPGYRLATSSRVCAPCGDDGQTWCGTYNTPICSEGHRVVRTSNGLNDALCRACGGDGQTWCGDYNTPTCDEGHRLVRTNNGLNDALCQPCGAEGQTYCGTSNNRICNEGLRPVDRSGTVTCQP